MPTAIILVLTIVIIITVIPYAFSSVLKQMEAVRALEAAGINHQVFVSSVTQNLPAKLRQALTDETVEKIQGDNGSTLGEL